MIFLKGYFMLILLKSISAQINMTDYYRMPKIFALDDYDKCFMKAEEKSIYCYVDVIINPNKTSELWSYIEKVTNDSTHFYNHDRINRGVCINWCNERLKHFNKSMELEFYQTHFQDTAVIFPFRDSKYQTEYSKLINLCINLNLKNEYGLMGYSKIEYCITNQDTMETDSVDKTLFILIIIIFQFVFISTYYDYHLKNKKPIHLRNVEHYKSSVQGNFDTLMVAFSLNRNWFRLLTKESKGATENFQALQSIRVIIMFGVIYLHVIVLFSTIPQLNPEFFEIRYFKPLVLILGVNGPLVIQTNMGISGFLLVVQFFEFLESKPTFEMRYFWRKILNRYLRFIPVYGFVILFTASMTYHGTHNGPVWKYVTEPEQIFCRKNWWTNILLINNYVYPNEACMQHGWYLAAEFQSFIVSLSVLMLIWRYPKFMKIIIGTAVSITFLIPAIIIYIKKYDGVFSITPESQRYMHLQKQVHMDMYIPGHTNLGGYMGGIITGTIYFKYYKTTTFIKSKIYRLIWILSFPLLVIILYSGAIFYAYDIEKPAIWISVYGGLLKLTWGILIGIFSIGFASGLGWKFKDILQHDIFGPLGRITFCVYLSHAVLLRILLGNIKQPVYLGHITLLVGVISTFIVSYFIGLLLCLCIELPFAEIQKLTLKDKRPSVKSKIDTEAEMKRKE